jgi:hypothetical protein
MRSGLTKLVVATMLTSLGAAAFAQPPAAELPIRLIAEAEDFSVVRGPWRTVPYRENYFAATFAVTFLSRMACLGAPAQIESGQEAVATQKVEIPYSGEFHVLARYEQPYNFSVEFAVEIEQGGKTTFQQLFGRLQDPKIWAFNGHKRVPMERHGWGGTDNIVWQQAGPARLAKGPATIRLLAGPQMDGEKPRLMAARRHVDLVCLTNDTAGMEAQKKTGYLEFDGWLVQDGDLFVRITNPRDGLGPCIPILEPFSGGQHSSYWVHVRDWPTTQVLKSGQLVTPTNYRLTGPRSHAVRPELCAPRIDPAKFAKPADPKKPNSPPTTIIPEDQYLQPGDTSGWVPFGQALDALNDSHWFPKATYLDKKAEGVHLKLEFAIPDGKGGLKLIREITVRGKPEYYSTVTFLMPGNVTARPLVQTQVEALQWLLGEVGKFPKRGSVAKRLPIYGILSFSSALANPGPVGQHAAKLALMLGDNTIVGTEDSWARKLGVPERKTALVAHWPVGTVEKRYADAEKSGLAKHLRIVSFGDEIHIAPLQPEKGKEAEFRSRFVAWLKARGVKTGGAQFSTAPDSPWYYYSTLYSVTAGIEAYARDARFLESKGILSGANYSPHANYLVTELQWVRPFKMKGLTMPWSEDYVCQIPEFSVQVVGYLTSGFRAGAKYHNLPIMMYVMPHSPGNTPRDFRLSFYTCIAHGAKLINYFCASPLAVGGTENYIATADLGMWRALHDCTHEAGVFEDYVVDGKVRPARVGLLLSSVDEILTGDTNFKGGIHNLERKALYFALRHSQVPVDFLTEDDVIEGLARDYQVLYVTQQHLHSSAVKSLQQWVEQGGTLVAACGGGFVDEFQRPNPAAAALYGVRQQRLDKDPNLPMILAKQDLPPARPLDVVSWIHADQAIHGVPVIAWKQTLVPADATVLGVYADGKPAVVKKAHGKGKTVLFGFLPGAAYLRSGLPLRPVDRTATDAGFNHLLPTTMDTALRDRLVNDFLPPGFVRPVECSEPLVEATCIDTPAHGGQPARLAVPLINYTGRPLAALQVRINGLTGPWAVKSVERGALKAETRDGATTVTLPLDTADMLLVDR